MNDLISIIVPVYKVEKYIRGCIDSILNQTYTNLEIILVDDGSVDNCPKIIDEYAKKDNRIKVIHKENGGLSSARNAGIDIATGKYIGFVDSDDTINLNMYENLHDVIVKNDADIVFSDVFKVYLDDNDKLIIPSIDNEPIIEKSISNSEAIKSILMDDNVGNFVWNKLFKRELFDDVRFPEGKVYEDAATTYKLVHKANKIVYTNQKLYYYLYGRIGAITSSFSEKKILDCLDAYSHLHSFLIKNYEDIKDYLNLILVKMYTSAMEKICLNDFNELWNSDIIISKYETFKEAMDNIDSKFLNENLQQYRLISAILLRYDRETYKELSKLIASKIKE